MVVLTGRSSNVTINMKSSAQHDYVQWVYELSTPSTIKI